MVSTFRDLLPYQFGPLDPFIGALCIAAIASVVIFVLIAIWVYRDAEMRGMDGNIWAIGFVLTGFFLPFIGGLVVLVLYLILRAEHPSAYPAAAPGVPYAGIPPYPAPPPPPGASPAAAPQGTSCRSCGAPLRTGAAFCAACGAKV